jgi:hypothetical protein
VFIGLGSVELDDEVICYYPPPGLGVHSPLGDRGALTNVVDFSKFLSDYIG